MIIIILITNIINPNYLEQEEKETKSWTEIKQANLET